MKFIKGVIDEMKLVTWPNGKETRRDTSTVIVTSILFAIYFALCDWAIISLLDRFIGA
ncbi:preprotein translocase subunit SecE [Lacticaseibacillus zhaodongensis]|uniref:preprotein translocase subunit SecE n=1 Tax=Lacticaseibacillus zhaodongensis TaxID=2668065 RepID=UPI0012D358C0|nr:preprotein translocase subunit SecE [Lacticaseibacillus zhaodongensis]